MDPHLINLETGTFFETGFWRSLTGLNIDQIDFDILPHITPEINLEVLGMPISLN